MRSLRHYALVDYATQIYLALVGVLMAGFHSERTPVWAELLVGHVVVMGLIHGLVIAETRGWGGWVVGVLRQFYPLLLYVALYRETAALNRLFWPRYLDPEFLRFEAAWFGGQRSLEWMERLPLRWVSEVLYAAYFSYYWMIGGIGIALYLRGRAQFAHFVTVLSLIFYTCYFTYIFLPVVGPPAFYQDWEALGLPLAARPDPVPEFPPTVRAGVFYRVMAFLYAIFEGPGAAFPSSHVAVACATLWFSGRYLPRLLPVHTLAVGLLCVATVYCRYHYLIDVIAGLATVAVLLPVANAAHARFERNQSTARS